MNDTQPGLGKGTLLAGSGLESAPARADTSKVLYFLRRGESRLTCETRLKPDGVGYELAITEDGKTRVEYFDALPALLSREHELIQAWRALGWIDVPSRPANPTRRR